MTPNEFHKNQSRVYVTYLALLCYLLDLGEPLLGY